MKKITSFALTMLLSAPGTAPQAADSLTIIHLQPHSPETSWFRVAEWPSYLFMPDAPLRVAVSRSGVTLISAATGVIGQSFADLDCSDMNGQVFVGAYDPNGFDADGDGIGCE